MEKKIPTYRIVVNADDEKTGVYAVSLVDEPAIEVDWIKLSKQVIEFEFSVNKDKQMLFGPLLIPGKLIFRRDEKGNEYNIVFDEETIQTIADKYNENKLNDVFNFQHSDKKVEAALLQNWITGEIDKSQEYGFTLPKGTWFGGVKVKDENFWMTEVKTDKVKGFSVEIMAGTELVEMSKVKCTFAKRLSLKSVMAVRECLGCPPNGDGTTTKGEPDKRCSGGKTKTATPKAAAPKKPEAPAPKAPAAPDTTKQPEVKMVPNGTNLSGTAFGNVEMTTKSTSMYNDRNDETEDGNVPVKALVAFFPEDKKEFDKLSPEDKDTLMEHFKENNERAQKGRAPFETYPANTGALGDVRVVGDFVRNQKGESVYYQYIQRWD
jgi:hypothetical protein